ncbi:hypothetical protein [Paenibacillus amylolyticus]|uniref:hypothetical protein n=1 Tax=Paenibacillus amylolyticus TaxID=1451 RepID=UPI003EBDCE2F
MNKPYDCNSKRSGCFYRQRWQIGGTGHFIHPRDFELYPNAQEAITLLKQNGMKVFALTNQHRISRGQATVQEFEQQFQEYGFDQAYICSHEEECGC